MAYHVELYDHTNGRVVKQADVNAEPDVTRKVREYAEHIRSHHTIVRESEYALSPRGLIIGQSLYANARRFDITTSKLR